MKIFLLEDELSQQIRVEKHIAEIAKELEIKLEVISTIDGFKDYKDVNVTLKPNRLETLFPNPSTGGNLNVQYKINEANSAYLMITSYYMTGATSYNYIIDKDATEKNIEQYGYKPEQKVEITGALFTEFMDFLQLVLGRKKAVE